MEVLVQSRALADFFETAAQKADPRKVANYMLGPLLRECNARGLATEDPSQWAMKPEALAELARIVDQGLISAKIANDIFGELFSTGAMPEAYVKEKGLGLRRWRPTGAARPSCSAFLWARSCAPPGAKPILPWSMNCWAGNCKVWFYKVLAPTFASGRRNFSPAPNERKNHAFSAK